jgi:choline dehydrogenase-like flavoprotein
MAQAGRSWLARQAPELVARLAQGRDGPLDCDLLIVGSGYGGAVAAARAAGHRIAQPDGSLRPARIWVLERGSEHLPGGFPSRFSELAGHVRFDMQDGTPARGRGEGLFDARLGKDVCVLLGNGLGGGSLINAGVMERPAAEVFARGWPAAITRETLHGGFEAALAMLSPRPVPDDKVCSKLHALDQLLVAEGDGDEPRRAERCPITVHWKDEHNAAGVPMRECTLCGDCLTGCNQGAKGSLDTNYLAHARARRVELFCGGTVRSLARGADGAWHVRWAYTDRSLRARDDEHFVVRARRVVLAAGSLGSTEILLRSRSDALPLSDALGKGFSTNGDKIAAVARHPQRVGAVGDQETDPADREQSRRVGPTITGLIRVPAETHDGQTLPGFAVEEFAVPAGLRNVYGEIVALLAGIDHGRIGRTDPFAVTDEDIDHIGLYGFMGDDEGSGFVEKSGTMVLPPVEASTRGSEGVRIDWRMLRFHPLYERMGRWLEQHLPSGALAVPNTEDVPDEQGLRQVARLLPPVTVHPLGGCRMADRIDDGVVDDCGRVFDPQGGHYKGLVVLDGSIVPRSLSLNPALTIAALAERAMPILLRDDWGWQADAGDVADVPARPQGRRRELPARDVVWSVRERMQGPFSLREHRAWARMDIEFEEIPGFRRALALRSRVVAVRSAALALYDARDGDDEFTVDDLAQAAPRQRCTLAGSVELFAPMPGATPQDERVRLVYRLSVQSVQGSEASPLAVGDVLEGVKVFGVDPQGGEDASPWRQLSEMRMRCNGTLVGRWSLDMADLAQRRDPLLRLAQLSSMPDALDDAGAVVLYVLRRALARIEGFYREFKSLEPSREGLEQRWPVAEGGATVVPLADGARLTHYPSLQPAEALPPLLLIHGLGSSGASFIDSALPVGPVAFLRGAGRDVWVLDVRSSIGNKEARHALLAQARQWTVEGVANADLPAAIDAVLRSTGKAQVDVFAHCMGAVMFCLAALGNESMRGKVRAAVLSQVGPLIRFSPMNLLRGYVASYLRQYLRIDLLDTTPDFRTVRQDDGSLQWEPRIEDDFAAIIVQRLVDMLLFTFPYPDDDGEAARQTGDLETSDFRRVRHRGDAIFGQLFELKNIGDGVLARLQVFMGWVLVPMLAQAIHFARRNMLTDSSGRNAVLHRTNFEQRFAFPLLMIHGRRNRVFDWRGSLDSLKLLMKLRGQSGVPSPQPHAHGVSYGAGTATQLAVLDRYGHLDCIIGRQAHEQVLPRVRAFFEEAATLRAGVGTIASQFEAPWIGPVLGWLQHDRDGDPVVHARVLVHPQPRRSGIRGAIVLPLRAADAPFDPRLDDARFLAWPSAKELSHAGLDLQITRSALEDFRAFALLTVHDDLELGPRAADWLAGGERVVGAMREALTAWLADDDNAGALACSVFTLSSKVVDAADRHAPVAPPRGTTQLRLALASCQYPPGLIDERPAGAAYERLQTDVAAADGPQCLVLCGDQVYLDETAGLFDPLATTDGIDAQDARYDRSYELTWRLAPMRRTVARLPVLPMLDDHEVRDNWKGWVDETDPPHATVERAMRAYERHQGLLAPARPLASGSALGRSYVAYPAGVPLIVLDTRSRRTLRDATNVTAASIVPPEVMRRLKEELARPLADAVKLVVSPSPILPPERHDPAHPAERLRSDTWSGFPASTVELLGFIRDEQIRRVVFLSGDAHLSSVSSFTFEGTQRKVVSVVSSGLYTPWPFANQRPDELVLSGMVDLGWPQHACRGTVVLHAMSAREGYAIVALRHGQDGSAFVDVCLRAAHGATTDCSVALD